MGAAIFINGTNILSMCVENLNFWIRLITCYESKEHAQFIWPQVQGLLPPHNTAKNLRYVGPHHEAKYYVADYMSGDERGQFSEWCEELQHVFI